MRLYFCDKCEMTESQFNTHFLIKEGKKKSQKELQIFHH